VSGTTLRFQFARFAIALAAAAFLLAMGVA
jgi:hypothetical protein